MSANFENRALKIQDNPPLYLLYERIIDGEKWVMVYAPTGEMDPIRSCLGEFRYYDKKLNKLIIGNSHTTLQAPIYEEKWVTEKEIREKLHLK